MTFFYRRLRLVLCAALILSGAALSFGHGRPAPAAPKYVFLFLADGGGPTHLEIARQYSRQIHNQDFVITDKIVKEGFLGLMTTHAADSLSTDSAAAATAMANGCKANIGALGTCADGTAATSAMELARRRGMRLGLVTNSTVYDSSPAAFLCHVPDRRNYASILDRYLEMEPDVLMGGGSEQFLPAGRRADEVDRIAAFKSRGYQHVRNKGELANSARGKVLGLFSRRDMSFELDRDATAEPSLGEMTAAAIRLLHDRNPNGFFAFIESESIDTAGHLSDLASLIREYREFDRAVGLAYEFYRKYPRETLILVTSDHETGGLGFTQALKDLSSTRFENQVAATAADLRKLQGIKISLSKAVEILGRSPTPEALDKLMQDYFPGFVLAPEYRDAILHRRPLSRTLFTVPVAHALGAMIANNVQGYWQTSTHTNKPVLVAALGNGAERFKGYYDNAEFGIKLKSLFDGKSNGRQVKIDR